MTLAAQQAGRSTATWRIRVTGLVQGVGFRPFVWRVARDSRCTGWVRNDNDGVSIALNASRAELEGFVAHLRAAAPPLARIDDIAVLQEHEHEPFDDFAIVASESGTMRTAVSPDAATCADCLAEILNPFERRFRYPFANCTNCGPRLSVVERAPYDRSNTTMAPFAMCPDCEREYADPDDRRFHAQPVACHRCGPKVRLERMDGRPVSFDSFSMLDDTDAVAGLIERGEIVAVKGLGGFHLACDARNETAVAKLRARKRRSKPAGKRPQVTRPSPLCGLSTT